MASDLEYIASLTEQLVSGFPERVEYTLRVKRHTDECPTARPSWAECDCPETAEMRVKTVRHAPLVSQLQAAIALPATGADNGGRSATRVDSPFPGNFEALALVDELKRALSSYVRRARVILGYDVPPSSIVTGAVCGDCAGALKLHNGRAVCIGRIGESAPCGTEYTWQDIERYLKGDDERAI
ncbi:hypothetical protein [Streptomyces sp. NPDC049887]|uniref:hypothetical protein n=1 Tax=Streptomyces sp. NPDC049887 TaxID=3155654 RepID=UPI00342A024A